MSIETNQEYDDLKEKARAFSQNGFFGAAQAIIEKMMEKNPERVLGRGRAIETDDSSSQTSDDIIY